MNGIEKLVKTASAKLGMKPENLMNALEKGDMNSVLANMKPADKQKMKSILENGTAMEKIMGNPQAAAMMRQMKK
ncbi:MAG: hypothetical protein LBC86_09230 [Oscillospiraceae bacterium]|jgi:uncharacterized protein with PhoU and TrkA domain|nr:hypothetical protein [Oscillospiraceae bacterium]